MAKVAPEPWSRVGGKVLDSEGKVVADCGEGEEAEINALLIKFAPALLRLAGSISCGACIGNPMIPRHSPECQEASEIIKEFVNV